ncbi:DUF4199 domain-containing protein [Flavobacteriaceae bacterium]|nr:DUF4199 domain-containing protein [Flavobacteriaceae bacterium]
MEKLNFTPEKTALNFGLLLGGISVIFGIMLYVLDMHYHDDTSTSLISYTFLIGIIVWGIIHFRKENNGYLTLSNALKTGLGIALISSITVIYIIYLINFIDPEFIDKSMEFQKQKMLQENPEISIENVNKMIDMQKEFSGPFIIAGFIIIFNLFFGFIISLISGLMLKKSQPE